MKKLLCLLLTAALLCSAVPVFAEEASFAGGDGTAENPYQIATLEHLENFGEMVRAGQGDICAILTDDIVINEDPEASVRAGETEDLITLTPLSVSETETFSGTFDGNGHTITGLYCNSYVGYEEYADGYRDYALFISVRDGGCVKNLNLDKVYLAMYSNDKALEISALVLWNCGSILNCSVSGTIIAEAPAITCAGGISAMSASSDSSDSYFQDCRNDCDISLKIGEGILPVGGISGSGGHYFENCINTGDIQVSLIDENHPDKEDQILAGGIVGANGDFELNNCYNLGNITVDVNKANYIAKVGGIIGKAWAGSGVSLAFSGLYNLGNITVKTGKVMAGGCIGSTEGTSNTLDNSYNKGTISATCIADDASALAGGITATIVGTVNNAHNYGDVTATGKSDSEIFAGGIVGNPHTSQLATIYNLGSVSASGNNSALAQAISAYDASEAFDSILEAYSLEDVAPLDVDCVALTQEEFKTLWTDEAHPEWDYAPIFEDVLYQETPFCDTHPLSWYYDASVYAYQNKLMNGISMTEFAPDLSVTRAMFVTVLYRLAGSEDVSALSNPFADVEADAWYTDAVIWAANNGIVNGITETTFCPQDNITREQIATILYRYVTEYLGQTAELSADLSTYPDSGSVSAYAQDAMTWAVGAGLITGTQKDGQTLLDPQGLATRAQMATILMRALENGTL